MREILADISIGKKKKINPVTPRAVQTNGLARSNQKCNTDTNQMQNDMGTLSIGVQLMSCCKADCLLIHKLYQNYSFFPRVYKKILYSKFSFVWLGKTPIKAIVPIISGCGLVLMKNVYSVNDISNKLNNLALGFFLQILVKMTLQNYEGIQFGTFNKLFLNI